MRMFALIDDPMGNTRMGVIQVCVNKVWGEVCMHGFGSQEADIVCSQQEGFTGIGTYVVCN